MAVNPLLGVGGASDKGCDEAGVLSKIANEA